MASGRAAHPFFDLDMPGLNHETANLSLTKSIFATFGVCTLAASDEHVLEWSSAAVQPPTETIEPSLAFNAPLPSSPYYKLEPSTPSKGEMLSSTILGSSPLSVISPRTGFSHYEMDEFPYATLRQALNENKSIQGGPDRLQRRAYGRKRAARSSPKSRPTPAKSGMHCALIIEQNEFACSYPGCIDKHSGDQKRFKRQEHKKRHEKTVHEKDNHPTHQCWVPGCGTKFSRTDNLKSHLRNTHSKKPGVRGNRYVATLDKNSEYYDPEWVGELDKNGYPILA
jgi:hypothetical protein